MRVKWGILLVQIEIKLVYSLIKVYLLLDCSQCVKFYVILNYGKCCVILFGVIDYYDLGSFLFRFEFFFIGVFRC